MSRSVRTQVQVSVTDPSGQSVQAAHVYTVSQLNQHTAQVLEKINNSGTAAVVTRHGRFVALITPLSGAQLESVVLSRGPLADEFAEHIKRDKAWQHDVLSPEDVDREIDSRSADLQ